MFQWRWRPCLGHSLIYKVLSLYPNTRNHNKKLQSHLDLRKLFYCFTSRVVYQWKSLPTDVVNVRERWCFQETSSLVRFNCKTEFDLWIISSSAGYLRSMLRTGIAFGVCLSVRTKSRQLLIINWCNLVVYAPWWTLEVVQSWRHLTSTFDLESYFRTFSVQVMYFKWLVLATSFSVWRYTFRVFKSPSRFKVMGLISRSRLQNSGSAQVCAPSDAV